LTCSARLAAATKAKEDDDDEKRMRSIHGAKQLDLPLSEKRRRNKKWSVNKR